MKPAVIFAGAGPGDPELITVKGMKALQSADVIVYAGSLVPETVLKWAAEETECINSAPLNLEEIVDILSENYHKGKNVVRLHTGDPSLYGAIFEQIDELKKRAVPFEIIPGVTAAFAAAAALGIEYTLPEITQTLILTRMEGRTPVPELEALEKLAAHQSSMVIYLSMGLMDKVIPILKRHYGETAAVAVIYRASHPDEKIIRTSLEELQAKVTEAGITKHAVIVISKVLGVTSVADRSKLYDKTFTHEYRKGSIDG